MAGTRELKTDGATGFQFGQMLLLHEKVDQNREFGRKGAYQQAAAQIPLVFDSPALQDAVRRGDPLLPSLLAMELNMFTRRGDWEARRQRFVGPVRDAHLAEAERRAAQSDQDPGE